MTTWLSWSLKVNCFKSKDKKKSSPLVSFRSHRRATCCLKHLRPSDLGQLISSYSGHYALAATTTIIKWRKNNYFKFPWRETENKWHALVAEIMLQRTKAEQVIPVFKEFCAKYREPLDYLDDHNNNLFEKLGLKWRATELLKLAEILSAKDIPVEKSELLKLPGIGEYIASAYRSLHLKEFDVIIDSNIVRLYGRYFGFQIDGETRRKKWFKELANGITPKKNFYDYNYGLIDFTRNICVVKPVCAECPLIKYCSSNYFINH